MFKKIASGLFAVFLMISVVLAATGTYQWTNAIKNTDGSDIPLTGAGSISSSVIEYGSCLPGDVFGTKAGEVLVTGNTTLSAVRPDLSPGRYCNRMAHRNTYGNQGPWSDVKVLVVDAPTPGKPQNFSLN